jgi:hypothetical protein
MSGSAYPFPKALSIAARRAAPLNGLKRHAIAPCSRTCDRTSSSLCAVMKITGVSRPRRFNSWKRSGPDIPGILMSRIRHSLCETSIERKYSSAEENARTTKPNFFSRCGSDSRIDSSSSITETWERIFMMGLVCRPYRFRANTHPMKAVPCELRLSAHIAVKFVPTRSVRMTTEQSIIRRPRKSV